MYSREKMGITIGKKAIAMIFIVVAFGIVLSYFAGRSSSLGGLASSPSVNMNADADSLVSAKYGHVHALVYIPETKTLLLGSHFGLFKSSDGGSHFTKVSPNGYWPSEDMMAFAVNPQNHLTIYASGHGVGVLKSTDGGETWEKSDNGIQGTDIHGLTINQRAPNYLYAFSVGFGLFRSQDEGKTWQRMDDGPRNPSVRALMYMAVQTDMDKNMKSDNWGLLFAGTADGLYQSFSCFCGWTKSSQDISTTIYSVATHQSDLTTMYAATKDGIWKSTDEGASWKIFDGITRGRIFAAVTIDSSDPKHLFASTEDGVVFESLDAGTMWMLK